MDTGDLTDLHRIVTLNIRHGGAKHAVALRDRLLGYGADVLVVTEFRDNAAGVALKAGLQHAGYALAHPDVEPARNTVLIASRKPIERAWAFNGDLAPHRLWCADTGGLVVCGALFPQKTEKLPYWSSLVTSAAASGVDLVIGDFNTGNNHLDKSLAGAKFNCADMPERLIDSGYVDLWRDAHPLSREYSWFSNTGNGFRIDHAFARPVLAGQVSRCEFDHAPRISGETDHSAIIVDIGTCQENESAPSESLRVLGTIEPSAGRANVVRDSANWTRASFTASVGDRTDEAFLEVLFARAHSPSQVLGSHDVVYYASRPKGGVFFYPFGLRHPPFQLLIGRDDRLMVRGNWRTFPKVAGHDGFTELAAMLGQDQSSGARSVPVDGLDADDLWDVAERVSRLINS